MLAVCTACGSVPSIHAQTSAQIPAQQPVDTAALNRTQAVRDTFAAFYVMDYDPALQGFERIAAEHPDDPLATDFVLDGTIFKELNRLDLLDTTFYAHDGFLTGKHVILEDPAVRDRVRSLAEKAVAQADTQLKKNSRDVDALYARGWARSLEATYIALVERGFVPALKLAIGAKDDDEAVLKIDPNYVDADLVVGTYQYVVGALPFSFRMLVGIAGISGSKEKGMAMLRTAAAHGVRTSIEARTCMMLFLRREAKYGEAESIAQTLAGEYPHGYLFQLEAANLAKDAGNEQGAIEQYERVLQLARQPGYFHNAHLELGYFGLGDTLRGQKQYQQAAAAYRTAAYMPTSSPELKQRCLVNAGKSFDLLHDHTRASQNYQEAVNDGSDTAQGVEARKLMRKPFQGS